MRTLFASLAGFVAWTALWLGGNAGLALAFPEETERFQSGGTLEDGVYLAAALVLAAVCSVFGGRVSGMLAKAQGKRPTVVLAILLVAVGAAVQASAWDRMPLWYHLAFLALLAPLTIWGGRGGRC